MRIKLLFTTFLLLYTVFSAFAQTGEIRGKVYNELNNKPIEYANIVVKNTSTGTISDKEGRYKIDKLSPGLYTIVCSFVGYKKAVFYEVRVSSARPAILDIPMQSEDTGLDEVVIQTSGFNKTRESPVSLRTISSTEIYRNPGGNRDISKVIQTLPGVASTVAYRNDIIVRGGSPNENRFFIDGIEIPNINHFATQGSSGGPVGMINVNFIRETDFYAGAFPANRGNALSSVMELKQLKGNDEKILGNLMLGSSDLGLTLDGPSGKNSNFIFSLRRSYLQFLFKFLKLPFLPTYNDFQYKHDFRIDEKNKLTVIGIGAIDDFELNKEVNKDITDEDEIKRNEYILGNLPVSKQWNYAIGAKWTHFYENSYHTFVVSRNHLNNTADKYKDNIEQAENKILDYTSHEIENKLRYEKTGRREFCRYNYGAGYEKVYYKNTTFNKREKDGNVYVTDSDSDVDFSKYSLFGQLSKDIWGKKLSLSLGIRTDINTYSKEMNKPLDQLSPRFSLSYSINPSLGVNFNIGRYYQLPSYTVLGYRNNEGVLKNKENGVKYIRADHIVGGLEYIPDNYSRITLEAFHKKYSRYPFLVYEQISLANLGGDFGVVGNDEVISVSEGRSYGIELLMQRKLIKSFYGILSYTWVRSEFKDKNGKYIPSSWDNRHILNITAGYKAPRNWQFGMKFRLLGGAPYTPYDVNLSSIKEVWDVSKTGQYDWNKLNSKRNPLSHGLDIRIDKKWFFDNWSLNLYMDIQNVYNNKIKTQAYLDTEKNDAGEPIISPDESADGRVRYKMSEIENTSGTVLPSIGIMIEF